MFLSIDNTTTKISNNASFYDVKDVTLDMQLTFAQYTIGAAAFFGSFAFLFFAGTGLVAIPFHHVITFFDRPKPMNESQFKKEKDGLVKEIEYIL